MLTYNRPHDSVDVSVTVRVVNSVTGLPETGVVFNSAGIDLWYRRELAASVDITEATLAALTTAHADGGFLHINDGYCRLDIPDAAVAAGASGVLIGGAITGMVVIGCYIHLGPVQGDLRQIMGDTQSATDLKDFADAGYDPATNKVQGVVLVDTLTTYTSNTPQTGDSFERIGAAGAGLTVLTDKTGLIPDTIDGFTLAEMLSLVAASGAGKASGMNTATGIFRSLDDSKDRITATQDAFGNRTSITYDVT